MTNQELVELAKLSQAAFFNRRSMEWQLLLAYWTGIALTSAAVLTGSLALPGWALLLLISTLWALFGAVWYCCIVPIQVGHAIDQAFFIYFIKKIEGATPERPNPKTVKLNKRWLVGQVLFSGLLTCIASILIATHKPTGQQTGSHPVSGGPATISSP